MEALWLIGIGTGSPAHVTLEGMRALREAAVILVPHKGREKDALAALRYRILGMSGTQAEMRSFDYPERDPALPYEPRVIAWHDEIARRWIAALEDAPAGPVALLVWGDPSLFDSTLRIAERLKPRPQIRVVPGITAIQALTAAHAIPLNSINGSIKITTGRQLRNYGWPEGEETVVVMLDAECSFRRLALEGLRIWWGAYLGSEAQALEAGPLTEVSDQIEARRAELRARHGWIMDTYLLQKM